MLFRLVDDRDGNSCCELALSAEAEPALPCGVVSGRECAMEALFFDVAVLGFSLVSVVSNMKSSFATDESLLDDFDWRLAVDFLVVSLSVEGSLPGVELEKSYGSASSFSAGGGDGLERLALPPVALCIWVLV